MPSFARVFQNEIVIKTLYCNKFAIHNTIDIVEVIGSSPTNPTIVSILIGCENPIRIFSF